MTCKHNSEVAYICGIVINWSNTIYSCVQGMFILFDIISFISSCHTMTSVYCSEHSYLTHSYQCCHNKIFPHLMITESSNQFVLLKSSPPPPYWYSTLWTDRTQLSLPPSISGRPIHCGYW